MIKRPNHRRDTMGVIPRIALSLLVLALFLLALVALSGCRRSEPEEPPEILNFMEDIPLGKPVLQVQQMDTDSDKSPEWVVFYRFDQVGTGGPVAALIYDVVRETISQLPIVYPYKLRTPDQNYLADEVPALSRHDILPESGGTPRYELVFSTDQELAVFRLTGDPEVFTWDHPPLYECIGFFRSDEVAFNEKTFEVTVTSNAGFERSQLVSRSYYRPALSDQLNGYFVTTTTRLPTPYESQVDFREGKIPDTILDTPYPEKIVLAFYQTLGKSNPRVDILYYLTSQAASDFKQGKLKYGSPFPTDQLAGAVVKELSYYATQDTDKTALVRVSVVFHPKSGPPSKPIETRWRLVVADKRWQMDFPAQ